MNILALMQLLYRSARDDRAILLRDKLIELARELGVPENKITDAAYSDAGLVFYEP